MSRCSVPLKCDVEKGRKKERGKGGKRERKKGGKHERGKRTRNISEKLKLFTQSVSSATTTRENC